MQTYAEVELRFHSFLTSALQMVVSGQFQAPVPLASGKEHAGGGGQPDWKHFETPERWKFKSRSSGLWRRVVLW
jgi:hypothetical protein